jgi:hypothetical protein
MATQEARMTYNLLRLRGLASDEAERETVASVQQSHPAFRR